MMQHDQENAAEKLLLTIPEAARLMNVSRAKVYGLLAGKYPDGIPVIRLGRSVRINISTLRCWLEQHQNESNG